MAVIDMPLEELKQYKGISPCPADFDIFWQDSLDEMKSVDAQTQITKADFQTSFADCYDMYFTGVRDTRVYAKLLIPKGKKNCPAVLCFHGYTGSSGDWIQYLSYAAQGFVVAAMDCRGQGGKSQDSGGLNQTIIREHITRALNDEPRNSSFRNIFLDTAQLADIVSKLDEVDPNKLAAKGGSQGGALTIACSALANDLIKKAVSALPFLSDYKRVWEMDMRTGAYMEIWDYFRRFDPLHENEDEVFNSLGYIDVQNFARWVKADVLMALSLRDDVCPPSTQFAVYNKITSNKQMQLYHDFGHEGLPLMEDKTFTWLSTM